MKNTFLTKDVERFENCIYVKSLQHALILKNLQTASDNNLKIYLLEMY